MEVGDCVGFGRDDGAYHGMCVKGIRLATQEMAFEGSSCSTSQTCPVEQRTGKVGIGPTLTCDEHRNNWVVVDILEIREKKR